MRPAKVMVAVGVAFLGWWVLIAVVSLSLTCRPPAPCPVSASPFGEIGLPILAAGAVPLAVGLARLRANKESTARGHDS